MGDRLRKIVRLFGISAKMDLAWLLRDTRYAVAAIAADLLSNLSTVSGMVLIALRFDGIGGMRADEVLFMMALSTTTTGVFTLFGGANNIHISRIIGRGQLEHLFLQPVPIGIQLLTMGFLPFTGAGNLVMGVVLLYIAGRRLDLAVTAGWVLLLLGYLLTTLAIMVGRAYLVSSLAFYAPVAGEEIAYTAIDGTWLLGTFPLSGMPQPIQQLLITFPLLPEGLMAWFPAMCLLGRPPLGLHPGYPMLFALLLATLAAMIFRKGLRHYVTKGSNRYVPYGFRR